MDHPMQIGGLDQNDMSVVVEIDASKFFHRKYNRGQWREGHWVFGGVERNSEKCFLVEVPDRTEVTLLGIGYYTRRKVFRCFKGHCFAY
jgi:hypothetical protein